MIHALTIDVEDYHSVTARDWQKGDCRPTRAVVENTQRLLTCLADHGVRATFFMLGEVAETFPELVRGIAGAGHELGVHGFYHRQVFKLSPEGFRREVEPAKKLIEDLIGSAVDGHRAPAFSIMPQTSWALEALVDLGFRYDSSVFPIKGRRYGWPQFPLDIHEMQLSGGRTIVEAPMTPVVLFGKRLPACGGGYFRHFPAAYTHWALRRIGRERPAIVYLHPYEIETSCPAQLDASMLTAEETRIFHRMHAMQMRNRETVEPKLRAILSRHEFGPLREVIARALPSRREALVAAGCGRPATVH